MAPTVRYHTPNGSTVTPPAPLTTCCPTNNLLSYARRQPSHVSSSCNIFTPRADDLYDLFPLNDLNISRQTYSLSYTRYVDHVAGWWDPYNLHDLAHVSWVRAVLCRSCTTSHLTTASEELDDLDHHLSVRGVPIFMTRQTASKILMFSALLSSRVCHACFLWHPAVHPIACHRLRQSLSFFLSLIHI